MIRIPYLSNPITEAVSSYKMNDTGKIVIGSMIAQAVSSMVESSNYEHSQRSYEEEAWNQMCDYFSEIAFAIKNSPEAMKVWDTLPTEKRRQFFIDGFNQGGLSHLVPMLTVELDKYFPC